MAENPLSGDELFALGKALVSEILAAVESRRAYYLGLSPHEPPMLLSKVFNPETGPIIPYLAKVRPGPSRHLISCNADFSVRTQGES